MPGFKLIRVSKKGPRNTTTNVAEGNMMMNSRDNVFHTTCLFS